MLLFLVSIPIAIGFALTRLAMGRHGQIPNDGAPPFRNRIYSGLKRMSCVWGVEIGGCALAFVVLGLFNLGFIPRAPHFLCLVGIALIGLIWGVVSPRTYEDGIDRVKSGRRLAWGLLSFYLFFVLCVAFVAANAIASLGFGGQKKPREFVIESPDYVVGRFQIAGTVSDRMIPPGATDIKFVYRPGLFGNMLGSTAQLRCVVEKDALLSFAEKKGYKFRSDSYTFNACAEGPKDCDFIHYVWRKYNNEAYPREFLAYNYRYATCGGYSFFYDVKAKTLYADWSSN